MDDKFDDLMDKLRSNSPSDSQVEKWKNAVRHISKNPDTLNQGMSHSFYWSQMVAALFIGVVVGGLLFGNFQKSESSQEFVYEDATIEMVYTKL